jgi:FKBP-type peptidyl-prolyl cis-trans isomerase FklB
MDSLSAAIGVSFSSSLASQGVSNINTEVLTKTINAALKGEKTAFSMEKQMNLSGIIFKRQWKKKVQWCV